MSIWYGWDPQRAAERPASWNMENGLLFWEAARCYRDSRYQNIWLVGHGSALALSGELFASYADFPLVVGTHDQMLKCLLHQSGLDYSDLVVA